MKFLMYSQSGEGAQILKKIELEGNDCALYIHDKIYKNVFDGLIRKVNDPESYIDRDTAIIFDISGNGKIADEWRKKGHYIYGASKFADDLEHDRNFGFEYMSKAGIKIPEYKEFKSFSDGIEYVRNQADKNRLVFKPNGNMPCKLTYVSDDNEQLISYLKFVEKRFKKEINSFILQEFIEGIVVSSEFFCSNGELLWPSNHTVEVKKSMNRDLGPSTGCSGNITWPATTKIIEQGIYKAKDFIKEQKYTGQIDLNAVVNQNGEVYGLEWTPRFGYDATPTFLTLLEDDIGKFFSDCARGESKELKVLDKFAGSVRMSIPPYPMEVKSGIDTENISPNEGIPIQNWDKHQGKLYFYEVMCNKGELVHSGGTGVICLGIEQDSDAETTIVKSTEILKDIKVPDKQYRTDLDEVLGKMVKEVLQYA